MKDMTHIRILKTMGAIYSTKIYGKFRSKPEWIGLVQPEKFRKNQTIFPGGPLFSVGPVQSKWTVPFDLSNTLSIPVPHSSVFAMYNNEGTHLSLQLLWIVDSGSISVTHTSMCSYNRSEAAS